ncbi:hypothetical protein MYX82_07790 [Acidobacteria bacterium AH-259-D05]|nr:hypothetical protein [Acidobacteria bacterium AH-259-D05]
MSWRLLRVFGKRAFFGYGVVALLSVSVLAALHLASRYGLHAYVSDQLRRIPWDISLIHRGEPHRFQELYDKYKAIPEVRSVEMVGFLRIQNMAPLQLEINGESAAIRWMAFVASTNPELLPPELREPLVELEDGTIQSSPSASTKAALVGADQGVMKGDVVRLSYLYLSTPEEMHEHGGQADTGPERVILPRVLFEDRALNVPPQIERKEFNKWMLREIGSLSYLPEDAIVLSVSMKVFEELAERFHSLFFTTEGIHGGERAPPYIPEVTHLISIEREALVSSWDLERSLRSVLPIVREVYQAGRWLTPFSYVNSDLFLLLTRMNAVARLIGLVTLLIAIPFLWMSWVLARTLGRLLILNERRLIGLALIRGIPLKNIERALLLALLVGGVAGGLLGLMGGAGLPLLGYHLAGYSTPPPNVLLRGTVYFVLFLGLGVLLAVLSGRAVVKYVRRLTPREAVAHVEATEESTFLLRSSWVFVLTCLGALVIGTYKIVSWIVGYSLLVPVFQHLFPRSVVNVFSMMESLLNFVAIPLFLSGLAGLVMWRTEWLQKGLNVLTSPLVGALGWFVSRHMARGRHRIANLFFVAALAMSLSLLPQVAADGFYGRVLRGMRASVGGDVLLEFDMADLTGGEVDVHPVSQYQQRLRPQLNSIQSVLAAEEDVASVAMIEQFIIPGIYIPGQTGLPLNVIQDPEKYLELIYYEDGLGITRGFSPIIRSLMEGNVSASQGLFRVRSIPLGREVILGYGFGGAPVHTSFGDVIAFLPGEPALGIENREGFVTAEINYLNHLLRSDARIIASHDKVSEPGLRELEVLPSRVVFMLKSQEGVSKQELARKITAILPLEPDEVRWEALERERVSKDMFISLALENMKVYMVGGLVLALASVAAIALVNFAADRRTFALLRLRGVPLPILLRIALSIFLIPVAAGVVIGILLGAISGYGISQAVWDLPRIYGVAGFLSNHLVFSNSAWAMVVGLSVVFAAMAVGFGLWLFRRTAREAIRER